MNKKILGLLVGAVLCAAGVTRADFKYTESAKITGGMVASMIKIAEAFNKQAREPIVTTHYVKGNRMRTDQSDGQIEIVDVDGRRFISIDPQKKTYSVATFDEVKAAMEKVQEKLEQKGAKLSPKAEVTPTENTKVILGQPTREVRVKLEMEMKGEDPQTHQTRDVTMIVTSNMWVASSVRGYEEIRRFYESVGKELHWQPRAVFGADPKMAEAMAELQKKATALEGMPLLQHVTIGMPGVAAPSGEAGEAAAAQPAQQEKAEEEKVASPGGAVKKGLGGLFGGFGRKKKQEKQEQPAAASSPSAQPGAASLADMATEVTAFSAGPLTDALFEIPAGYREVSSDIEKLLKGSR